MKNCERQKWCDEQKWLTSEAKGCDQSGKMKVNDFKVGDGVVLCSVKGSNVYNRGLLDNAPRFIATKIKKVGNKYLTTVFHNMQFHIDTLMQKTDCSCDYYLFRSLQEAKDFVELEDITQYLVSYFCHYYSRQSISISQARRIKEILEECEE